MFGGCQKQPPSTYDSLQSYSNSHPRRIRGFTAAHTSEVSASQVCLPPLTIHCNLTPIRTPAAAAALRASRYGCSFVVRFLLLRSHYYSRPLTRIRTLAAFAALRLLIRVRFLLRRNDKGENPRHGLCKHIRVMSLLLYQL